ncbi:hypothetical protein C9374_011311 [Naegleria lovaniensis]|uniref:Guanine nucleotide-binding protein subunit beta-like protein n=1 Tax=Naegleria lovaniensis TaxID=51637 RepID=A0AA88KQM1_NAELO|nr:uncharacterized protein C9374_011311 [Naegleria lovaniensis]KAG2392586.1 hypothetical protein C9374_011311 [Naegleria lovaniensis]
MDDFKSTLIEVRQVKELIIDEYSLELFKLNCVACLFPYVFIASRKSIIIYRNGKNSSLEYLHTIKVAQEINFIRNCHNKIFFVGEEGMTMMILKQENDLNEFHEATPIAEKKNQQDLNIEQYGLKLINLYQNSHESTWSISYDDQSGIFVVGDNSHVIKVHSPDCKEKEPFTLEGHSHNLPCLHLFSKDRLLSCSIDKSCKVWDLKEGKVLYNYDFNEWCWIGARLNSKSFLHAPKDSNPTDIFLIGTQSYIYLLSSTMDTVLYKLFLKPIRGLRLLPGHIYGALERVSLLQVIEKHNLVLLAKQNDNKILLFRMIYEQNKEYSLMPVDLLPSLSLENQCVIGLSYCEELDRIYVLCLDKQMYCYDLRFKFTNELHMTHADLEQVDDKKAFQERVLDNLHSVSQVVI